MEDGRWKFNYKKEQDKEEERNKDSTLQEENKTENSVLGKGGRNRLTVKRRRRR
jgi:hypothetical protein